MITTKANQDIMKVLIALYGDLAYPMSETPTAHEANTRDITLVQFFETDTVMAAKIRLAHAYIIRIIQAEITS